ncbi:MAG: type II toxin-antitoxin system HicB family antitoxin [Vampirovibrio sp.]|nr:type II toxin-antitoxin system HicB family antitoxin [Vampirovibrio sp.]
MTNHKTIDYYLDLPWSISCEYSDDTIEPWTARVTELQGCMSHGKIPLEAIEGLFEEALPLHLKGLLASNNAIPEPIKPEDCKGEIAYRTTPSKHYQLLRLANSLGKSLNKVLDDAVISYLDSMA